MSALHSPPGPISGTFETVFRTEYMRNHKAIHVKNLRCFPQCGPEHKSNRFCGSIVVLRLSGLDAGKNYEAWSEFSPVQGEETFGPDTTISTADFEARGYMRGVMHSEGNQFLCTFQRESKGWHYGWMAGRSLSNLTEHEMRIYIFEQVGSLFRIVFAIASPPFRVLGRKRVRTQPAGSRAKVSDEGREDSDDDDDDSEADKPRKRSKAGAHKTGRNQQQAPSIRQQPASAYPSGPTFHMGPPSKLPTRSSSGGGAMPSMDQHFPLFRSGPPELFYKPQTQPSQSDGPTPDFSVLDLLWQPTPPNTVAHLYSQQQQQQQPRVPQQQQQSASQPEAAAALPMPPPEQLLHDQSMMRQFQSFYGGPNPAHAVFRTAGNSPDYFPNFGGPMGVMSPDSIPPMLQSPSNYPPVLNSPNSYPPFFPQPPQPPMQVLPDWVKPLGATKSPGSLPPLQPTKSPGSLPTLPMLPYVTKSPGSYPPSMPMFVNFSQSALPSLAAIAAAEKPLNGIGAHDPARLPTAAASAPAPPRAAPQPPLPPPHPQEDDEDEVAADDDEGEGKVADGGDETRTTTAVA